MTLKVLYKILEDMEKATANRNRAEFNRQNIIFECKRDVYFPILGDPPSMRNPELGILYENCRQSFLGAFIFPDNYEEFLKDGRRRLEDIPTPK
jgi:hypothetical protein